MDIKLENILISSQGVLRLCDFSFTTPANNFVNKKMGTMAYMAPELYNASNMPCKAQSTDMFSMGVLFFMLAFGAAPFQSAEFSDGFFNFLKMRPGNKDFFRFHPHTRSLFSSNQIPKDFQDLILELLKTEPNQRVQQVEDLISHPFFTSTIADPAQAIEEGKEILVQHAGTAKP